MRLDLIASFLGWIAAVLAAGMVLASVAALAFEGSLPRAAIFLTAALITLACAGFLILSGRGGSLVPPSRADLCLLAVLGWAGGAFFAALPFYLTREYSALAAWFEALSGLTTTGAVMMTTDALHGSQSLLFWRALLQWIGGGATLVMALLVLVPLGRGGMELRRTTASGAQEGNPHRLLQAVRFAAPAYALLTALCFLALWVGGGGAGEGNAFTALCLALSTLSTGGFDPGTGAAQSATLFPILAFFMLLGALGIPQHREMIAGQANYWREPESRFFLLLAFGASLVLGIAILFARGGGLTTIPGAMLDGVFAAISLLSTTGYMPENMPDLPPILILALTLAGGATLSTAGGVKALRLLLLFRQSRRELAQLAHPHSVLTSRFAAVQVDAPLIQSVWEFLLLVIFSLAGLAMLLALCGLDFLTALSAATAALANAGPILHLAQPDAPAWPDMPVAAIWLFSIGMIAGRVELFAFFSIFTLARARR